MCQIWLSRVWWTNRAANFKLAVGWEQNQSFKIRNRRAWWSPYIAHRCETTKIYYSAPSCWALRCYKLFCSHMTCIRPASEDLQRQYKPKWEGLNIHEEVVGWYEQELVFTSGNKLARILSVAVLLLMWADAWEFAIGTPHAPQSALSSINVLRFKFFLEVSFFWCWWLHLLALVPHPPSLRDSG